MIMLTFKTLILVNLVIFLRATRILLVVPYPALSHQIMARSLAHNLAETSEVVVVTTHPAYSNGGAPANYSEVDVSDRIDGWNDTIALISGRRSDSTYILRLGYQNAVNTLLNTLQKPELQSIYEQKFDLVVEEAVLIRPIVSLVRDTPIMRFSTLGTTYLTDFDLTHDFFYPQVLQTRVHNLSFWENIVQVCVEARRRILYDFVFEKNARTVKELLPFPTHRKRYQEEVQMMLLNSNALWDGNRPRPLNFVYVGGIHNPRYGEMSQDFQNHLNSSIRGVIYVSFGTSMVCSQLSRDQIRAMVRVLSRMPYDVFWKWEGDLPETADNIRVFKWLPQTDVLRHPNLKLFITQAGYHSTEEAIQAGVPLLGIPLATDQWYNSEKYVHFKIGERIDLSDITEESFKRVIDTVINNETYRHNMVRLRDLIADQPLSPEQLVAWSVRRARRRSGALLRPPATGLTLARYYELELLLAVLLVLLALLVVAAFFLRRVCAFISNQFGYNFRMIDVIFRGVSTK